MTKMWGIPVAVSNSAWNCLREREAWIVVDRNSKNACVFGARYQGNALIGKLRSLAVQL